MTKKPFIVGIAGASCSGKTWFAKKMKDELSIPVCIFSLDNYYKELSFINNLKYRHDNPNAIEFNEALSDLILLINGETVMHPIYNYGNYNLYSKEILYPAPVIIIEGIFSFFDKRFLSLMNIKIWIESYENILFNRRISRDINKRGDNYENALNRYQNEVKPAFSEFYKNGVEVADCIFLNIHDDNRCPNLINILHTFIKHSIDAE